MLTLLQLVITTTMSKLTAT